MRYQFLISAGMSLALAAAAQNAPQGLSALEVAQQQQEPPAGTNAAAAASSGETTNQVKNAKASFLMDAGVQYADEGEYEEAEQAYLRALEGDPENPDIRFRLSTLYIMMERYRAAAEILESLAEKYPDSPAIRNNLAWIYATGGEMRNGTLALRQAREAVLIDPYAASVWNTLAEAYYASGQYDKALRSADQAIELLKMQGVSEETLSTFEAQRAKIQRADQALKLFSGVDAEK
jgi:tetratricopeptide (TPR) repeat protein